MGYQNGFDNHSQKFALGLESRLNVARDQVGVGVFLYVWRGDVLSLSVVGGLGLICLFGGAVGNTQIVVDVDHHTEGFAQF